MYKTNEIKTFPAVDYENDGIYFANIHIMLGENLIDYIVPEYLLSDFKCFISNLEINDATNKNLLEIYNNWFQEKLSLKNDSVWFVSTKVYYTKDIIYDINNNFLKYNQRDHINCKENDYLKYYNDKDNHVIAYLINNEIMAIASASNDGEILEVLPEQYINEYGIPCLKKLVNEFRNKNLKLRMEVFPELGQKNNNEIINQMEMEWLATLYSFKIKSKDSFNDKEILKKIFK